MATAILDANYTTYSSPGVTVGEGGYATVSEIPLTAFQSTYQAGLYQDVYTDPETGARSTQWFYAAPAAAAPVVQTNPTTTLESASGLSATQGGVGANAAAPIATAAEEEARRRAAGGMFGEAGAPLAAMTGEPLSQSQWAQDFWNPAAAKTPATAGYTTTPDAAYAAYLRGEQPAGEFSLTATAAPTAAPIAAPAGPMTLAQFQQSTLAGNYDEDYGGTQLQRDYAAYLSAQEELRAQGDPLATRRGQSSIAELYGMKPLSTGSTTDYSGLGEGGYGAVTKRYADNQWYNPIRFTPEMLQYFDANLPAGWDEGLPGALQGAGTVYGVNTGARGANWQNQATQLANYMSQFNDPGAQAFAAQLRDPATLEGLAQASEQRAQAHKAGAWKTGMGVASVIAPMVVGPLLQGLGVVAAPAAASAADTAAAIAAAEAAGAGIAGGTAFGAVGGGGLGLAGAAGGAAAGQAQGFLSKTLGMDPGFVSTLTDKAAAAAAKAAVQAAAMGGDPLKAAMGAALRAGAEAGAEAGMGALGDLSTVGFSAADLGDLGDIDIPQEGMFGQAGETLRRSAMSLPDYGQEMLPGELGGQYMFGGAPALAEPTATYDQEEIPGGQQAPAQAPEQPGSKIDTKKLMDTAKTVLGVIEKMGGDTSETGPERGEEESEEVYSQRLVAYLGLNVDEMAERGLKPGTPEYARFIMEQTDSIIAQLGLDPEFLGTASVAELQSALRGKNEDELAQLYRALYVRGQMGGQSSATKAVDPFTSVEEELGGPVKGPLAIAAAQRGQARSAQELAALGGREARAKLDEMTGRTTDLYGLQQSADARALRARLEARIEEDEELRRRRGETGFEYGSDDALSSMLADMSPEELQALLQQLG